MLELFFIRHGRTDYNAKRKVMGRQPIPLDAVGQEQCEMVANYLKDQNIRAVISSPMLRTMQTAEMIASFQNGVEVEKDDALSELDYGDWVERTFEDLVNDYGEQWKEYRTNPENITFSGGESIKDAAHRIREFMDKLLARFDYGKVALISHADVIKIAMFHVLGLELKHLVRFTVNNCAICLVRITPDTGPRLVMLSGLDGIGENSVSICPEEAK